jgi:hypothetical protein
MKKSKVITYSHHFTLQYDDGWRTGGDGQFEVRETLTSFVVLYKDGELLDVFDGLEVTNAVSTTQCP